MLKKIVLTVLSFVFAYNVYKLVVLFLKLSPEALSLLAILVSAIAFNLLTTGILAFLGFVYPTSRILPDSYYNIKNVKNLNLVYSLLGVAYFRFFLLKTFYRPDDNKKYFNGTKSGLEKFNYNTKQSEFGHLVAFILICFISILLLDQGHTQVAMWTLAVNIVFNLYPIILQRKHRIIVQRLLKINKSRSHKH